MFISNNLHLQQEFYLFNAELYQTLFNIVPQNITDDCLCVVQEMIRRLEEQLKQLQAAKEELEARQNELTAMMARLEESKNMEAAERAKLEDEIRAKQEEVSRIQETVDAKDEETRRLQVQCSMQGFCLKIYNLLYKSVIRHTHHGFSNHVQNRSVMIKPLFFI